MDSFSSLKTQSWLSWFLRGILILGMLIIFGRIIELQIIKGGYYRKLAEENRIKRTRIPAPRGKIFARGGEVLAGNLKKEEGFERNFVLGGDAAHVTGYLGEVSGDEVGKVDPDCPEKGPRISGSLVGRTGLEEKYNCILSGTDGEELVEIDTAGKTVRTLGKRSPVSGGDLKTSIDFKLQKKTAEEMKGKKGAAILTDSEGNILALYSYPSFDPNIFVQKNKDNKIREILDDPNLPLFNRAIGGIYHPGSTFKPIVAIAALSENKIDRNFQFTDPGVISVGSFSYFNWYFSQYGRTEGTIDVTRALARSTDTFFYKIGELTGPDAIASWADKFGLEKATEIDIPGEVRGLVPNPEWKIKTKGERWFLGNTYHLAIGQGDIAVSPISLNRAILAVATGKLCSQKIAGVSVCHRINVKPEVLETVKTGMVGACETGGTGFTFFDFKQKEPGNITVACKTGTAETSAEGFTHAWFSLFAPSEFPEIVMTVLIEKGGEGSKVAGPVARKIMDFWAEGRP